MRGNKFNNFDAGEAIELWNNGIPLDRAVDAFGNVRGQSKIRRVALENATASAVTGKASFQKVGKNADAFFDALIPVQASFSANAQIRIAKEDRLFERLRCGELIALGFPVHEMRVIDPEPVPVYLLERIFAKWSKRSFVGHGRHFADVNICAPRPAVEIAPTAPETERQQRGPKAIGPLVKAAIEHLGSTDPLFENRSQEKRINEVRAEVARQNPGRYPKNSQPGHTTVWNYLTGRKPML